MAATYSHESQGLTTIGNAEFDVRVRKGIGSVHCLIATTKNVREWGRDCTLKTTQTQIERDVIKNNNFSSKREKRSSRTTD